MKYLRVAGPPDIHGYIYIWFDLDARHETYIKVVPTVPIKSVMNKIAKVQDRYKKGLPVEKFAKE